MDNYFIKKNFRKADNQLSLIEIKTLKIKKEIYSLYDKYLKVVRFEILNSLRSSINYLANCSSFKFSLDDVLIDEIINNDIQDIVNEHLPFLTIEQLSILNKTRKKEELEPKNYFFNNHESNYYFSIKNEFINEEFPNLNFYEYYQSISNEINLSINLDSDSINQNDYNYVFKNNFDKNQEEIISSNFFMKSNDRNPSIIESNCENNKNIFPEELKKIIEWTDTLDQSLDYYLKNLSIEVNEILFKRGLIHQFINEDLFNYILGNNLLISNPSPYIIFIDMSSNQFENSDLFLEKEKYKNIFMYFIDSTELEYKNLNLNIIKNKIDSLKNNLNLLFKKQIYWNNKKYISSKSNKLINRSC